MKKMLFPILALLLLFSCKPKNYTSTGTKTANPSIDTIYTLEDEPLLIENKMITVTYMSATVYAGSSQYFFTTTEGKTLVVSTLNEPEEQTVKLPEDLLDPNPKEGPPSGNPKKVGKKYIIMYDAELSPVEVIASEGK